MTPEEEVYLSCFTERLKLWYNKEVLQLPRKEWTADKMFQTYKFCNVFRWQDRTSQYLYEATQALQLANWQRAGLRWLGTPHTIKALVDYVVQNKCAVANTYESFAQQVVTAQRRRATHPLSTGSFIVKRDGNDVAHLARICAAADRIDSKLQGVQTTLQHAVRLWREESKANSLWVADFTAGCILYDYVYWQPALFTDLFTWAPFGPGAKNGLRYLYQSTSLNGALHLQELVRTNANKIIQIMCERAPERVNSAYVMSIHGRVKNITTFDVEHWLCEYYKYVRGYSKNTYVPYVE